MDTAIVQQFLNFFQDYIDLCRTENWPDDMTSEAELKNAFILSQHIEKCLDKLQKKGVINEFLSVLSSEEDTSSNVLKHCLSDPPKYILKRIINSKTKINQMDIGFRIFLELFSEDKLENCLRDLMLEAASKETLLSNLSIELPEEHVIKFKSELLMCELNNSNCADILQLLVDCNVTFVELLVVSLLNNELKYAKAVRHIADAFLEIAIDKDSCYKKFWHLLFKVDNKYFIDMCVEHSDIYTYIVEALSDCGKLLREGMSAESFFIDLSKSELEDIVKRLCSNNYLKSQFFDILEDYDGDLTFWQNML